VASVTSECAWSAQCGFWIMSHGVQLSPATSDSPTITLPSPALARHTPEVPACHSRWLRPEATRHASYRHTSEIPFERPFFHGSVMGFPPRPARWKPVSRSRQVPGLPLRALAGRRERTARGSRITLPAEPPDYSLPAKMAKILSTIDRRRTSDAPGIDLPGTYARPGAGQRRGHPGQQVAEKGALSAHILMH
jgi:hypothetical protein